MAAGAIAAAAEAAGAGAAGAGAGGGVTAGTAVDAPDLPAGGHRLRIESNPSGGEGGGGRDVQGCLPV